MTEDTLLEDDTFELGRTLLTDFSRYQPGEVFRSSEIPTLIVHGDRDSYISYDIARAAARSRGYDFHTVAATTASTHGNARTTPSR